MNEDNKALLFLSPAFYDEVKRLGWDMSCFVRYEVPPVPKNPVNIWKRLEKGGA